MLPPLDFQEVPINDKLHLLLSASPARFRIPGAGPSRRQSPTVACPPLPAVSFLVGGSALRPSKITHVENSCRLKEILDAGLYTQLQHVTVEEASFPKW